MLFSVLGDASMNFGQKLLTILVLVFCVLLSLSVHELGHGLAAYAMGDYTAKSSGRLSLTHCIILTLSALSVFFCLDSAGQNLCRLIHTTLKIKRAVWC